MKHNWKHAPATADYHWICQECRMLHFSAIPDTEQECSGSISKKIEKEADHWQSIHDAAKKADKQDQEQ